MYTLHALINYPSRPKDRCLTYTNSDALVQQAVSIRLQQLEEAAGHDFTKCTIKSVKSGLGGVGVNDVMQQYISWSQEYVFTRPTRKRVKYYK